MTPYQYHNGRLCVSLQGLINTGFPKIKANKNGKYELWNKWFRQAKRKGGYTYRGGNGRTSKIEFEFLPKKYKHYIIEMYGAPPRKNEILLNQIREDSEARDFFSQYRIDDGRALPEKAIEQYIHDASLLNMIKDLRGEGETQRGFWRQMAEMIHKIKGEYQHSLPCSPKRLKSKYEKYHANGRRNYEVLISRKWNNKNPKKITIEIENWFMRELATTRQSIDMVYLRYQSEAEKRGWRTDITVEAFRKWAKQPRIQHLIDIARTGRKGFRQLYGQYMKLKKPLYSNDIWYGDGTGTGWRYRTDDGSIGHATTYFVMDSLSGKFLGWATNPGINSEDRQLQLRAFRRALRNSGWLPPYQIKVDNQKGHKTTEMREFLQKLAKHVTFSAPYRSSGRGIERAFAQFQRQKLSEFYFWSGFGRHTHSNLRRAPIPLREMTKEQIEHLPTFEELLHLLDKIIAEWNDMMVKGKQMTRNELWLANLNPEVKPLSLDVIKDLFFNVQGPKKYNKSGIRLRINGEDKLLEVYDECGDVDYAFRHRWLGHRFYLKYDPEMEFEEVELLIVHPTGGYQRIATAKPKKAISESMRYHQPGDVSWALRQMKLEQEYMEQLEGQLQEAGATEVMKYSRWRQKIDNQKAVMGSEQNDDADEIFINKL